MGILYTRNIVQKVVIIDTKDVRKVSKTTNEMKIPVGSKVKFRKEKQRYTVQASDERFAICTKPMNALKTVLYTIIDFEENRRGPEDLVFGFGAETKEQCEEMLARLNLPLEEGPTEVSSRHDIELDIEKVYPLEQV